MKHFEYYIIAFLLVVVGLQKWKIDKLKKAARTTTVIKSNKVNIDKPIPVVKFDTIYIKEQGKTIIQKAKNPVNKELLDEYLSLKDSISKLDQYKSVITEKKYIEKLEDSTQTIVVKSSVTGALNSQSISYITKEKKANRPTRTQRNKLFVGSNVNIPTVNSLINPSVGVNLHFQPKTNKVIYSIGYDTNKQLNFGVAFKLF